MTLSPLDPSTALMIWVGVSVVSLAAAALIAMAA
ncbi:MAG: hypothetical protein K0R58_2684 [Ramlibacter sp.]|jgi:hypothetical protein|nr:hypothetical protein [Ramlibacter sp.]